MLNATLEMYASVAALDTGVLAILAAAVALTLAPAKFESANLSINALKLDTVAATNEEAT